MGVVGAGSPIARGVNELFFGDEELASATFMLLVVNLVIARFLEGRKLLPHRAAR